jgi:hypothetical protein
MRGRLAIAASVLGAGLPFACGGDAFTAGSADGGKTIDGAVDGSSGGDSMTADAPAEGSTDAPADVPIQPDAIGSDGAVTSVTGTVVDQFLFPMPGIDVHCQGQHTTTAPDGTFTLAGITFPYIITAVAAVPGNHKHGYVFDTLYRKSPTLQLVNEQASPSETAGLSGSTGNFGPSATGIVFADFPALTPAAASPTITLALGASGYAGNLSWTGAASVSPTVYVLQWLDSNGLPGGYISYTSTALTLTGGGTASWNPAMNIGPTQAQLTATLDVASGYVPVETSLFFQPPGARVAAQVAMISKITSNIESFETPDIPGAAFTVCGLQAQPAPDGGATGAFGAACVAGLAKDATPTLAMPAGTTFVSPPTTAGIGTTFTFDPLPSGVYLIAFAPATGTSAGGDTIYVVTTSVQQKVPDLSLLGFNLPHGATYVAEVYGFAPFAGIDAATSPLGFDDYAVDFRLGKGPLTSGMLAHSQNAVITIQ